MNIKKFTKKDRHGNMMSFEFDTPEASANIPPMNMIPQYNAVGGMAANHPGEPKGSDTVPAWLTPGEFVVNKEAVDIYGPQIKKMNDVGREIQDGDMSPTQAPPVYASEGINVNDLPMWKQQLMEREGGYRSDIYDPFPNDGKWEPTTGYGHLLDTSKYPESMKGKPGPFKTEAAAREQFEKDVGTALIDAQSNIGMEAWQKLQPQQQWGLTNMAFQLGRTGQAKFENMIKAIQAEDYDAAKMHAAFNRNKNTKKYDIKTDWHTQTPTRVEDFNYFMSRWDPVNIDVPVSKPIEGSQPAWITRAQQLWQDMDKPKVEIPEANPSSGGFLSRWFPGHSGEKNAVPELDSSNPYDFKNKGGPIYASQGKGLGTYEEEMLKNLQHDYGSWLNPWDNTYSSGFDYGHRPIPEVTDPNVMQNVPKSEDLIENLYESIDSGQGAIPPHSDVLDTIDIPYADKHPGYNPIGDPTFTSAYDQMVQEEITGEPAYTIPPPPTDYNFGSHDTGKLPIMPGEEAYADRHKGAGSTTEKDIPGLLTNPIYTDELLKPKIDESSAQAGINYNQGQIETLLRDLPTLRMLANQGDKNAANALAANTKLIQKHEREVAKFKERAAQARLQKSFKDSGFIEDSKLVRKKIALENSLKNAQTQSEKNQIQEKLDNANKQIKEKNIQTNIEEISKNIDLTTEENITNDLDSDEGKQAQKDGMKNKKEVSKAKNMFNELFGDLIDKKELGRALAVYLGSRVLGYDHGSSIGYVAKQYMTNVDARNAQYDKWIMDNMGKFEPESMALFKETRDPNDLIPIGKKPRSTGNRKMYYHPTHGEGMAYEFIVENAQGKDETYWTFDSSGNRKAEVPGGFGTKDTTEIPASSITSIKGMLEDWIQAHDRIPGDKSKPVMFKSTGKSFPAFSASGAADEVAGWLHDRGIPPGKFKGPILNAYQLMIADNEKLLKEDEEAVINSSLIPYLEESTVKMRLEDMLYVDEKGKKKLIPSPARATITYTDKNNKEIKKQIEMDPADLVHITDQIESVYGVKGSSMFWSDAAKQWAKGTDPQSGETYRKMFTNKVQKEPQWEGWTPFALFAYTKISQEIAEAAKSTYQQ